MTKDVTFELSSLELSLERMRAVTSNFPLSNVNAKQLIIDELRHMRLKIYTILTNLGVEAEL